MKYLLSIISLIGFIGMAQAETRYIVDQIKLPMRTGESTDHAIVRMLPSGMAVELLAQGESGYSRVRTPEGREGWILTRYLMRTPAARDRLADLEVRLAGYSTLEQEKSSLEEIRGRLDSENMRLQDELAQLRETSGRAVTIADENRELKVRLAAAEQTLEVMRQEAREIRSGAAQKWFMLGGGAILLGVILGLILPGMRRRKKSRWGQY